MRELSDAGIAAGVVQNGRDLADVDEQLKHRDFYVSTRRDDGTEAWFDGFPAIFSDEGFSVRRPSPALGEHNDYVFKELLGLSDDDVVAYAAAGAFD